jgi:hypothetical protein
VARVAWYTVRYYWNDINSISTNPKQTPKHIHNISWFNKKIIIKYLYCLFFHFLSWAEVEDERTKVDTEDETAVFASAKKLYDASLKYLDQMRDIEEQQVEILRYSIQSFSPRIKIWDFLLFIVSSIMKKPLKLLEILKSRETSATKCGKL